MHRNEFREPFFPLVSLDNKLLHKEKQIANVINTMPELRKKELETKVNAYLEKLKQQQTDDRAIALAGHANSESILAIVLGFLPYLLGRVGNYPPALVASVVASAYVIYPEFLASVRMAVAIGTFLIYYLLLIVLAVVAKHFTLLFLVFLLPFFGYYSLIYQEYYNDRKARRSLEKIEPESLKNLELIRQSILDDLVVKVG